MKCQCSDFVSIFQYQFIDPSRSDTLDLWEDTANKTSKNFFGQHGIFPARLEISSELGSQVREECGTLVRELSKKEIPINLKVFSSPTAIDSQNGSKLISRVPKTGLSEAELDLVRAKLSFSMSHG